MWPVSIIVRPTYSFFLNVPERERRERVQDQEISPEELERIRNVVSDLGCYELALTEGDDIVQIANNILHIMRTFPPRHIQFL